MLGLPVGSIVANRNVHLSLETDTVVEESLCTSKETKGKVQDMWYCLRSIP